MDSQYSQKANMEVYPGHFVAIIGGSVAGSEAACRLAQRGIYSAVFEQNPRPYGKIEDGLPKWHIKLRLQEEKKIDTKLSDSRIFFIPNLKLGRDVHFVDLVQDWGLSAVLLANGAWKDRPLPVNGLDKYVGNGLIYQNSLVYWFNHCEEKNYDGEHYELMDDAIVIGGGLASLDVAKIVMLETVLARLKQRGIKADIFELERKTIRTVLDENNLTLRDLGLKGCTLYYRRRIQDMPLTQMPVDASFEKRKKIFAARTKMFGNFQKKYLFRFAECRLPTAPIIERERLVGMKFSQTEIINDRPITKPGSEHSVRSKLTIASIGSIPEPIPGIRMQGELYEIENPETGKLKHYDRVFALGNAVTGKGNIRASLVHGSQVSAHVMDSFLAWRPEDYQQLLDRAAQTARKKIDKISEILNQKALLPVEQIESLIQKIRQLQQKVHYSGNYHDWIQSTRE